MAGAPKYAQPRANCTADNALSDPAMASNSTLLFSSVASQLTSPPETRNPLYAPVFPALRRIRSPVYLTPLPLYGSGGLRLLILAATSPTCCLSAPEIVTRF